MSHQNNNETGKTTAEGETPDAGLRVARNTVILMLLRLGLPLLSMALLLTLSRKLGADGMGRYTVAYTLLFFFTTVGPLGLGPIVTREGARDLGRLGEVLAQCITLGTVVSLGLTALMAGAAFALDYEPAVRSAIVILSLSIVPATIASFYESAFIARQRMEYIAAAAVPEFVLKVVVGVVLLQLGYGLDAVLAVAVGARFLTCAVSAMLARREGIRLVRASDRQGLAHLIRLTPTFLMISVFATLYWRIDTLMLSKLAQIEDVGYYGAAWRLLEVAMLLPQSLCLSLYPQVAAAAGHDRAALARLGGAASRYLIALTLPLAVCTMLLAEPVLVLMYGASFRAAAPTLGVLMLMLVPYGIMRYHAYVLVAANRQRVDLGLNVLMTGVNIALNVAFIPRYGHLGAACATLVSICLYGLAQYVYLRRYLPGHGAPLAIHPIVLLASALAGGCVWLLRDVALPMAVVLPPLVYVGGLLAGGFFNATELQLLRLDRLLPNWAGRRS